ncbi:MAG: glycoside hydrolase family 1 protein [Candidatus Omnitrophica bacterium]|nr:glycoside hydrolase family 1 protein [Candidatus Omnitrophota bacterium]
MREFPKEFFWGSATSAYQVEGDNCNCDWWEWEKKGLLPYHSGQACRHYQLYTQDFDLAKQLNHNAHRFSVEWSRIQPQQDAFNPQEIQHYRDVAIALKSRGLEPVVTLHHFTNPLWFMKAGGWLNRSSPSYFLDFTRKVVEALCDQVNLWVTINEPMVYVYHAYLLGAWPPQQKSFIATRKAIENLMRAHLQAYDCIHRIYEEKKLPPPRVSIAKNMQAFVACQPAFKNSFAAKIRNRIFNFEFIEKLMAKKALDFIGVNYYTRSLVEVKGWGLRHLFLDVCTDNHSQLKRNSLGWDIYPAGLYEVLLSLKKYGKPVFLLENGICTDDDALRGAYIHEHLKCVLQAIQGGVDVNGYLYWSLLDNFEWDKGFAPRFGLIEVDYQTFSRKVRESARQFAGICSRGSLA